MNIFQNYVAYLKDNPKRYWFKRKLFGWGWTPATIEGWAMTFVFCGLIVVNFFRIDSHSHSVSDTLINFVPQTLFLLFLLGVICYIKGERPKWQWGNPLNKVKKEEDKAQQDAHTQTEV